MLYKNGKLSSFLKVITIQWNPWGYSHFHYFLSKNVSSHLAPYVTSSITLLISH